MTLNEIYMIRQELSKEGISDILLQTLFDAEAMDLFNGLKALLKQESATRQGPATHYSKAHHLGYS